MLIHTQCTPDFKPAFDNLAECGFYVGEVLTHWFDALYLLIFDRTTIEDACATQDDYTSLWQDSIANRMFGYNSTTLTRMSPVVFAITDGQSVVYVTQNPLRRAYAPMVWPFNVNIFFGIARVGLPAGVDAQDGGIGLFGCSCSDLPAAATTSTTTATIIQLQCAVITRNSKQAWILPVTWSLSTETQLLTCDRLRVVIQSLRWPQPRVAVASIMMQSASYTPPTCFSSSSNCVLADVAIYAIPVCGAQDGIKAMVRFFSAIFFLN